ncbi:MAG: XRE family transcriptional regulator [Flavobacterium sp.]|nr:MAG: XRE family transcriptional regulator [Flavobacterium sp.]
MQILETFGETLRNLREKDGMPLRKLAALLDIDQSTLSKIERNQRNATPILIDKLAKIFSVDREQLHMTYISDRVAYELLEEKSSNDILKLVASKIEYIKSRRKLNK